MLLDKRPIRLDLQPLVRNRYARALDQLPTLVDASDALQQRLGSAGPYLLRDVWCDLYDPTLETLPSDTTNPVRLLADWAADAMRTAPGVSDMRQATTYSVLGASEGACMVAAMLQALPLPPAPTEQHQQTCTFPNGDTTSVARAGNVVTVQATRQGQCYTTERTCDSVDDACRFVQSVLDQCQQRGASAPTQQYVDQQFGTQLAAMVDELRSNPLAKARAQEAMAQAVASTSDKLDTLRAAMAIAFGAGDAAGAFAEPDKADLALVGTLQQDPILQAFLRDVGRFLQELRTSHVPEQVAGDMEVAGVERTHRVDRLVPSELSLYTQQSLRTYALCRLVQEQATGWHKVQEGAGANGALHVALDISGSMRSQGHAPRALAAACVLHAHDNGRAVSLSLFSSTCSDVTLELDDVQGRLRFLRATIGIRPTGGTAFDPVLQRAATLPADADVLLVSDGDGPLSSELAHDVFRARGLFYLVVGGETCANATLRTLAGADRYLAVDNLSQQAVQFTACATLER